MRPGLEAGPCPRYSPHHTTGQPHARIQMSCTLHRAVTCTLETPSVTQRSTLLQLVHCRAVPSTAANHALRIWQHGVHHEHRFPHLLHVQVQARATLSPCTTKRTAELAPQRLRFCTSLLKSRPRLEQSPKRSSWRMRCATFPRHYAEASHGRSSPRRCCERAWMVDRSSLGGLFQPMALPEGSAPARGRPRTRISTCSLFRPICP